MTYTIELTDNDLKIIATALDAFVRAQGVQVVPIVAELMAKFDVAVKMPKEPFDKG